MGAQVQVEVIVMVSSIFNPILLYPDLTQNFDTRQFPQFFFTIGFPQCIHQKETIHANF